MVSTKNTILHILQHHELSLLTYAFIDDIMDCYFT